MGSVGLSAADAPAPHGDLEAVYQGGQTFADRLKALSDQTTAWAAQRDQAEAALKALNLGNDVAAARAAAQATQEAASKTLADARRTMEEAQAQADKIIAGAKDQAAGIVDTATSSASSIKADADDIKKKAAAYAAGVKKDADAALADAKAQQAAVAPLVSEAAKAKQDAIDAKAASDAATKDAQETKKMFQTKLAQIQSVVAG